MINNAIITSLLKPVDDVRAYKRIGQTLARRDDWRVNIIGFISKNLRKNEKIAFHPLPYFDRLSWKRLYVQYNIWIKWKELAPDIIIVTTFELLPLSVLYKKINGVRLVYDVQENYALNLTAQTNYPRLICHFLAWVVRAIQKWANRWVDGYILAENCYQRELNFLNRNVIVAENKLARREFFVGNVHHEELSVTKRHKGPLKRFLFTGNLSVNSGVLRAVALFRHMKKYIPDSELIIIGQAPSVKFLSELENDISYEILHDQSIKLIGGQEYVSHQEIISQIERADLGIISYEINASNENKIPSKLYEYMALGLPFVTDCQAAWSEFAKKHFEACILIDWSRTQMPVKLKSLYEELAEEIQGQEIGLWISEEARLMKFMDELIKI